MKTSRILSLVCGMSVAIVLFANALSCNGNDNIAGRTVVCDSTCREYIHQLEAYIQYLEESIDEISEASDDKCDYMGDIISEGEGWLNYYFAKKEFYEKSGWPCKEAIEE